MEHGLFGCIKGKHLPTNVEDLNETIKYVRQKSQDDRCILYHGFISLSAEEVISQGYKNRTKWKDLLGDKMNDVAKANNIKRENLEWISAFHMKKDQSHCHIIFWDKKQEIKDPYIPKKMFDEKMEWIRGQFAKVIFQDVFKELYKIKDEAFSEIRAELHPFFDDFNTIVNDSTDEEHQTIIDELLAISPDYANEEMVDPMISDRQLQEIAKEIMHIKDIIPEKGSLKYEYMPTDIKEEINKSSMNIIKSNAACRSAYHKYLETAEEIRKIYADDPESLKETREYAHSTIMKSVGNKILKAVKEISGIEQKLGTEKWHEKHELYEKEIAGELIMNIAFMLSRGSKSNLTKANRLRSSELSKQARIELAKKLENKSNDWGQYDR